MTQARGARAREGGREAPTPRRGGSGARGGAAPPSGRNPPDHVREQVREEEAGDDLEDVEFVPDRVHVRVEGERAFVRLVPLRGEQPAGGVRGGVPGRGLLDEAEAAGPDDAPGLAEGGV